MMAMAKHICLAWMLIGVIDHDPLLFRHLNVVSANVKKEIAEKIRIRLGRYPRWYADEIKKEEKQ